MAVPLNDQLKKEAKMLKEAITSLPVLRMPDFPQPFVLQMDASSVAFWAVLIDSWARQPIVFIS